MCSRSGLLMAIGLSLWMGITLVAQPPSEVKVGSKQAISKISGPYTYANLSIFLLHGKDAITGRNFLTLNEALEQKKIIVHETSNVNLLSVENTSVDAEIFIQSGDIVKGGRQDRLISYDMLLPPKSGNVPIPSFCVEAGRWSRRGEESAAYFASNSAQAGKDLKLAANSGISSGGTSSLGGGGLGGGRLGRSLSGDGQSAVWSNVAETQKKLEKTLNKNVMNQTSPSSYQLSLEDKAVVEKLSKYEKELSGIIKDQEDVIGIVFAVNGRVEGAETFACNTLCQKQWAKMLKSCAVDAMADYNEKKKFAVPTTNLVDTFIKNAKGSLKEVAQVTNSAVNENVPPNQSQRQGALRQSGQAPAKNDVATKTVLLQIFQCDLPESLMIESRETASPGIVFHQSYLRKELPKSPEKNQK